MTVGELLASTASFAEDGRHMHDEVLVKIDGEIRTLSSTFMDGTFILLAGNVVTDAG